MELKLLGTDSDKDWFAIFYIDRGEDLNAYIWSYADGEVKITDIYGMERYCRHAVDGIYVGDDMPQEFIERAYDIIKNYPKDKMQEMLDEFNESDEEGKKHEELYREREEYEDECIADIKSGKCDENGMYWFIY